MSNAIECNHVWKKYTKGEKIYSLRDAIPQLVGGLFKSKEQDDQLREKEFWVLNDVSFTVKKGEVVGVIGPNGAGKSTVLKLLSGIIKPNKGEFKVNGRLSALIEITAGFHPDFTGRENAYFNGTILGMSKKEINEKFDQIVEFSGIEEFIDTPVKRYSSGMYARLGFAVAAHINPDVLLVDEVLAVGDINFQSKCAQKMRELLDSGTTIVLVSHNIPLVQNLCSRIVLLDHGRVLKIGSPEEVIPFYENIVFKKSEDELKRKLVSMDHRIKLNENPQVKIEKVVLEGADKKIKDQFSFNEPLTAKIYFSTTQEIKEPTIMFAIYRPDGVVCCTASTQESRLNIKELHGRGCISLQLGDLRLAPGIYLSEAGVWDGDFVHPYAFSHKEIFRIEAKQLGLNTKAVFLPQATWRVENVL